MPHWRDRAQLIAADRARGASALLAELLSVLDEAMREGESATLDAARIVCTGQPALAPIWNLSAVALADFAVPGRYARRRDEARRAASALSRAAAAALSDALSDVPHARLLTLSDSGSVERALIGLSSRRSIEVIGAESFPGGEGVRLCERLGAAGLAADCVADALLTTYLPSAHAVIVGADAIAARHWTNKAGTFGVAAAASFTATPVFVVASREKAVSALLAPRLTLARPFEHTPVALATQFLTEAGALGPADVPELTERFAADLPYLLSSL